jgi:transcriptional regulator with XRE-family HTH domain
MLADQARVEQLMLLGRASGLLTGHANWIDSGGLPWAGKLIGKHWFAICGLGPAWVFDPHGCALRHDELLQLRTEIMASVADAQRRLDGRIEQMRWGPICERLYWSLHRRFLDAKRSVFQVPDIQLRQHLWGGASGACPRHWRGAIRHGLESLSWLHTGTCDESGGPPALGQMTALITHFADLRGSPNDRCEDDCPARGGLPHSHFLVNLGCGFLGCLEQCGDLDEASGIRHYEFPARGSRHTGTTLRQLGRSGTLMSVYLPSRLGEPQRCGTLTPDQHRLLQAMIREITRRRRNKRREFSEPEVTAGNSVTDAQGRRNIVCPVLTENNRHIGFNGNGKRRGCGYCLATDGGWLDKAGYDRDDTVGFFSDLAFLARRLDLTVVGLLPGTNPPEWLNLDRMLHLARQPSGSTLLRRANVRVYALADCMDTWNRLFGWPLPSLLSATIAMDHVAEICHLLEQAGVKRADLASGIGVDASLLSKILRGNRKCPDDLAQRVRNWLERRNEPATAPATSAVPQSADHAADACFLDQAISYRRRGWSVIPQVPRTKQPYVKWKPFQERLPTEAELEGWWGRWPDAGIALIAGPLSGVLVVDVDGVEAHEVLISRLGAEPMAPKVLSGSRKPCRYHLFFRHPDLSTGAKKTPWHPKLEFRGHAGLAVLPPSLHKSGNLYEWAPGGSLNDIPLPDLPVQILNALQPVPRSTPTATTSPALEVPDQDMSPSTRDFLSGMFADTNGWNGRLFRAACDLAARGVPLDRAEPLLLLGAGPWDSEEQNRAQRTIASAYSQPREPAYR